MTTNIRAPQTVTMAKASPTAPIGRKAQRRTHSMTLLHTSLVVGSMVATLLGANLLAGVEDATTVVDDLASTAPLGTTTKSNSALILAPIPTVYAPNLATTAAAAVVPAPNTATALQLNLDAVPEVTVPNIAADIGNDAGQATIDVDALLSVELPNIPDVQQSMQQAAPQANSSTNQSSAPVSRSRSSR